MYGLLFLEDSVDFEINGVWGLLVNMKSVVKEFDRRGDIIISQVINFVKFEIYFGKLIKLLDILDFL